MSTTTDIPSPQPLSVVSDLLVLPAKPSLLTLPREIRDNIYHYAICMLNQSSTHYNHIFPLLATALWTTHSPTKSGAIISAVRAREGKVHGLWRLLAVNRQIKIEVERVLYSQFLFGLYHYPCSNVERSKALEVPANLSILRVLDRVQRLNLVLRSYGEQSLPTYMSSTSWKETVQTFLGFATALRILDIRFISMSDWSPEDAESKTVDELVEIMLETLKDWDRVPTVKVSLCYRSEKSAVIEECNRRLLERAW